MTINIRRKGSEAELEIAKILNDLVNEICLKDKKIIFTRYNAPFRRNQNQTSIGGSDLENSLGLAIEVKRQEKLSIENWWNQCTRQADTNGDIPILIFKQNRKSWRVCMLGHLPLVLGCDYGPLRVEIKFDAFKNWFRRYYQLMSKSK